MIYPEEFEIAFVAVTLADDDQSEATRPSPCAASAVGWSGSFSIRGVLTEQRDIAAAQSIDRSLLRATVAPGMSRSAGYGCSDQHLDTTESGHSVPKGSPVSSSLPLVTSAAFGLRRSHGLPGLRRILKLPLIVQRSPAIAALPRRRHHVRRQEIYDPGHDASPVCRLGDRTPAASSSVKTVARLTAPFDIQNSSASLDRYGHKPQRRAGQSPSGGEGSSRSSLPPPHCLRQSYPSFGSSNIVRLMRNSL
jgi:hypothetical protein